METFNLFEPERLPPPDQNRPAEFRRRHVQIGPLIGAARLGATLYELAPGQRICPYHYEYNNEEWLLVIEGRPTLRTPSGERELRAGDIVAFAEGPDGAHDTSNRTDGRVRVVMLSTRRNPAIAVYPDSDKMAVWRMDSGADEIIVKRSAAVGYWEDEA